MFFYLLSEKSCNIICGGAITSRVPAFNLVRLQPRLFIATVIHSNLLIGIRKTNTIFKSAWQ